MLKRLEKTECFGISALLILYQHTIIAMQHKTVDSLFVGNEIIKSQMSGSSFTSEKWNSRGRLWIGVEFVFDKTIVISLMALSDDVRTVRSGRTPRTTSVGGVMSSFRTIYTGGAGAVISFGVIIKSNRASASTIATSTSVLSSTYMTRAWRWCLAGFIGDTWGNTRAFFLEKRKDDSSWGTGTCDGGTWWAGFLWLILVKSGLRRADSSNINICSSSARMMLAFVFYFDL